MLIKNLYDGTNPDMANGLNKSKMAQNFISEDFQITTKKGIFF